MAIDLNKLRRQGSPFEQMPGEPFLPEGHRRGLEYLQRSFSASKPVVVVSGAGRMAMKHVVDEFLGHLDPNIIQVRLTDSVQDPKALLHAVIEGVGLQPGTLELADLENMLLMFLGHMKRNGERLVVCIEDYKRVSPWVLDQAGRLVALEREGRYGMLVLLAGKSDIANSLEGSTVNYIAPELGGRFSLPPLALSETHGYLRRQLRIAGGELVELFDYQAVDLIHELCRGVIDGILPLAYRCLEFAIDRADLPVSTQLVRDAAESLRLGDVWVPYRTPSGEFDPLEPSLVAHIDGRKVKELTLGKNRVLLGRDESCDLCISHPAVSSHHAMVVKSKKGLVLIDLRSANGTAVNGRIIAQHVLADRDVIRLGTARIEYRAGASRKGPQQDVVEPTAKHRVISLMRSQQP